MPKAASPPRGATWWVLQLTGWLLVVYLTYAQLIPAFDYQRGVDMGTQDAADQVSEVGVAFFRGFAFADLVAYVPLLLLGLVGHALRRQWGRILLAASLGITIYWPIVCLAALQSAQGAAGWELGNPIAFWVVLPIIAVWGVWGLWIVLKESRGGKERVPNEGP